MWRSPRWNPSAILSLCPSVRLSAVVPSIQDPQGHNKTQTIFQPYAQEQATGTIVKTVCFLSRITHTTSSSIFLPPLVI